MKIYGPYLNKKLNRKHMIIKRDDGKKTTMSYPKWLMENYLGRKLEKWETVDHWDNDHTNDDFSNLRVISRSDHIKEDVLRPVKIWLSCLWCDLPVLRRPAKTRDGSKQGKAGPFCSKHCIGLYGSCVQNGYVEKRSPQVSYESFGYYRLKRAGVVEWNTRFA